MTICIFPGTFNPIHIAHLKMAEFALKNYNFEKIIFIPSYIPPHKEIDSSLAKHRFNMVKLAISHNKNFEVSDIEYKSEGKSYTLITVQKIRDMYDIKDRLNMIIGTDAFEKIRSWYKIDELKQLVHFIVFQRDSIVNPEDFKDFSFEFAKMDYIDVSSTQIRTKQKTEQLTSVKDYINNNELYN